MHEAIFIGVIQKKRWKNYHDIWGHPTYEPYEYWEEIFDEENPIWTGTFDNPILKKNERVHLHTINKTASVVDSVRSTDGKIIYYTDHILVQLEDEKTVETKQKAEEIHATYLKAKAEEPPEPRSEYKPNKDAWWRF